MAMTTVMTRSSTSVSICLTPRTSSLRRPLRMHRETSDLRTCLLVGTQSRRPTYPASLMSLPVHSLLIWSKTNRTLPSTSALWTTKKPHLRLLPLSLVSSPVVSRKTQTTIESVILPSRTFVSNCSTRPPEIWWRRSSRTLVGGTPSRILLLGGTGSKQPLPTGSWF